MPKYYYQIKGKLPTPTQSIYGETIWGWPPIVQDVIEADSKAQAREIIENEYHKILPMKVMKTDRNKYDYFLTLVEIDNINGGYKYSHLLTEHECETCHMKFTLLQKQQMGHEYPNGGSTYCSSECYQKAYDKRQEQYNDTCDKHTPVIYKITNKLTNKCYIGRTTQAFTFRWYQHVYQQANDSKFYKALSMSTITDWTFEVIEVVTDSNVKLNEREHYYVKLYDSINNGYNTATVIAEDDDEKNGQEQLQF